jgi:hypothetical protein
VRPRLPCGIVVTPCGRVAACRAIAGDRLGGEPQQWGGDVGGCDDDDDDDDDDDEDGTWQRRESALTPAVAYALCRSPSAWCSAHPFAAEQATVHPQSRADCLRYPP